MYIAPSDIHGIYYILINEGYYSQLVMLMFYVLNKIPSPFSLHKQ